MKMDYSEKTYIIENVNKIYFNEGTPSFRKYIVDIGSVVYDNLHLLCNVRTQNESSVSQVTQERETIISQLKLQIENIHKQQDDHITFCLKAKENEISSLKKVITDIESDNNMKFQREKEYLCDQINKLENEKETFVNIRTKEKNVEIDCLKQMMIQQKESYSLMRETDDKRVENNNSLVLSLHEQIETLQTLCSSKDEKLSEILTAKNMNVVKMGQIGELSVEEYVVKEFNEGKMENTSKQGGQGDMHFVYRDFDILIEVKNKNSITPDDVSKFLRDVKECPQSVGGVFVSIKPGVNIPCHSAYDVEWINGKPVIYVSNFETIPYMVYVAIKTIFTYATITADINGKVSATDTELEKYKQETKTLLANVAAFVPIVDESICNVKRSYDSLNKLQTTLRNQFSQHLSHIEEDNSISKILRAFSHHYNQFGKLPTVDNLKQLGITKKHISQAGGMRKITEMYSAV